MMPVFAKTSVHSHRFSFNSN